MATIVTRSGKGSALTHNELDANFTNLNTDKLETSGGSVTGNVNFGDNVKAQFGASNDLQIYHDGTNSIVENTTGSLYLRDTNGQIYIQPKTGANGVSITADGYVKLYYDNAEKLATTSTGIDVTGVAKASTLSLSGTTAFSAGTISQDANWGMYFKAATAGAQAEFAWVNSTGTERMRIDSSGNLLLNGTSSATSGAGTHFGKPSDTSTMPTYLYFKKTFSGARDAVDFRHNGTKVGGITFDNTSTTYATSSDYRLKENVVPMTGSIDRLKELKPSRFNFIAAPDITVDGFLAHEAQEVVPEAISGEKDAIRTEEYEVEPAVEATYDDDGNELTPAVEAVMGEREVPDYQGIDQAKLVPLLTSALQEAVAKIEALEARVEALENA